MPATAPSIPPIEPARLTELRAVVRQQAVRHWGERQAQLLIDGKSGIDLEIIQPRIDAVTGVQKGKVVFDIGSGAGQHATAAYHAGARQVICVDSSQTMLELARIAVYESVMGLPVQTAINELDKIKFKRANATDLRDVSIIGDQIHPDTILSVNLAPNLSPDEVLKHFEEMRRVLKPGGKVLFVAPASLDTVFTLKGKEEEARTGIIAGLEKVNARIKKEGFRNYVKIIEDELGDLDSVVRATFSVEGGKVVCVDPTVNGSKVSLEPGNFIVRKFGSLVVTNRAYAKQDYLGMLADAGLKVIEDTATANGSTQTTPRIYEDHVGNSIIPDELRAQLGSAYDTKNPFMVMELQVDPNFKTGGIASLARRLSRLVR